MHRQNQPIGILAMFGAAVLFAVMAGLVKIGSEIDTAKMTLFRFAVGLALVGTLAMSKRIELRFHHTPLLIARGIVGSAGVFFFYMAISKIGVGRGTVISYSFPVFASIFGFLILKERVRATQWLAIIVALAGIWLISRERTADAAEVEWIYYVFAVVGAMCAGLAVVIVRKLRESDSSFAIYLAQCVMGFWLMVIPANIKPVELDWLGGLLLVAVGFSASGAQILMTYAYAHIRVATGSLIGMLVPVLTTIMGAALFGEKMTPVSIVGIAMVVLPCAIVAIRRPPPEPSDE